MGVSGASDIDNDALSYNIESYYNSAWSLIAANDSDGSYSWDISGIATQGNVQFRSFANDGSANSQTYTSSNTYNIDNSAPLTSANFTSSNWQNHNINIALTCSDTGAAGCSATSYCADTLNTCSPNTIYSSAVAITNEGTNYLRFISNDTVNNTEAANSQIVKIDKTKPVPVFAIQTSGNSTYTNSDSISVYINITEANPANLTYKLYNATSALNTTIFIGWNETANTSIIWSSLPEGVYYYNVTAVDLASNLNFTEIRIITLDTSLPVPDFNGTSLLNDTYVNTNRINVGISVTETNPMNETFSLNTGNNVLLYYNNTALQYYFAWTGLDEGTYYYNASVKDKANNRNFTLQRKITLDRTAPVLDYTTLTPDNSAFTNKTSLFVNVSVTEINFANITFRLDNATSLVNSTIYTTSNWIINFTSLQDASYFYNVSMKDKASNFGFTAIRNITIDTIKPSLTVSHPISTSSASMTLNLTTNEFSTCYIRNATISSADYILANVTNSTAHYSNLSLGIGDYEYILLCADKAGNSGTEQTPFTVVVSGSPVFANISSFPITGNVNGTKWNMSLSSSGSGRVAAAEYSLNPMNSNTGLNEERLSYYLALAGVKNITANLTNLNLKYYYTDSEISGIDESTLRIFHYNLSSSRWEAIETQGVDTANNFVWANSSHFSVFGLSGNRTEEAPPPSGVVGGGAGGGVGSFVERKGFYADKKEIAYVLTPKEYLADSLLVTSASSNKQNISVRLVNLNHLITLSETELELMPSEAKSLKLEIIAGNEPRIYSGKIVLESSEQTLEIPVSVEIETANVLFDVKLLIQDEAREVVEGTGVISADISLFNVGAPRTVDVLLNYTLMDSEGNVLWSEHEVRAVKNRLDFKREFKLPELAVGNYVLGVQAIYYNSLGSSTAMFSVVPKEAEKEEAISPSMIAGIVKETLKPYLLTFSAFIVTLALLGGIYVCTVKARARRKLYMLALVQDCRDYIRKKDYTGASAVYEEIRNVYRKLPESDKEQFYEKIIGCYNGINRSFQKGNLDGANCK
ncbi:hypothetical protein HZB88_02155 [archaeon]|nr:hypothetical protein [archaeon]